MLSVFHVHIAGQDSFNFNDSDNLAVAQHHMAELPVRLRASFRDALSGLFFVGVGGRPNINQALCRVLCPEACRCRMAVA